jgi:hypothetical protein
MLRRSTIGPAAPTALRGSACSQRVPNSSLDTSRNLTWPHRKARSRAACAGNRPSSNPQVVGSSPTGGVGVLRTPLWRPVLCRPAAGRDSRAPVTRRRLDQAHDLRPGECVGRAAINRCRRSRQEPRRVDGRRSTSQSSDQSPARTSMAANSRLHGASTGQPIEGERRCLRIRTDECRRSEADDCCRHDPAALVSDAWPPRAAPRGVAACGTGGSASCSRRCR